MRSALQHAAKNAARSAKASARTTRGSVLSRLVVVVLVVALTGAGVWAVAAAVTPSAGPTTTEVPALALRPADVAPGSLAPVNATIAGAPQPDSSGQQPTSAAQAERSESEVLTDWANEAASVVDVPARALLAYANAELSMRSQRPSCNLSWATLAGLGRIESQHGQYGGTTLRADGRPATPIVGVPLDGSPGVQTVADTDDGRYDGDPQRDRAVGPMQFIPSTWAKYAVDADGDGVADPQQIDDAAGAAARYLCVDGRDMTGARGWWSGVMSYNNSVEYAQKVFGLADRYAKAARMVNVTG